MSDPIARLNVALSGRYTLERELGEGGMATVYLADDLKHNRPVALKVLKPELAAVVGADRFLAEIETTANLSHPHILPLFDSGEADSFLYYVMPYIEGESLREKLDRERQLSVREAVQIATDLAGALDYAHRHEIIHRDIKPANIMLQDGRPVIADFGIALAVGSAGGARLTETGLSVGTPYYMSPEQATGDSSVGPATDIYALACVLYEMLVGEPPFPGATAQAVLGKIIAGGPVSATEVRPTIPAHVDAAIRKALEKLPADRFGSAAEFADALSDASFRYGDEGGMPRAAAEVSSWKRRAVGAAVVALLALTWAGVATMSGGGGSAESQVLRYSVPVVRSQDIHLGHAGISRWGRPAGNAFDIAPDGRTLVYGAWTGDEETGDLESRLYLRRLDRATPTEIAVDDTLAVPFFSPDGRWIGALRSPTGPIVRISVASGAVETVAAELPADFTGADWSDSGEIFVTDSEARLWRIPQAGGEARRVELIPALGDTVDVAHPLALSGGRIVLFSILDYRPGRLNVGEVRAVDVETGESWTVIEDAMDPGYLRTGHLLFMRRGTLMAVSMDAETTQVSGAPVTILDDVMHSIHMPNTGQDTGVGHYATSAEGHLAYLPGGVFPLRSRVGVRVWPDGRVDTLPLPERQYTRVRVSPDGSRLALTAYADDRRGEILVHDLPRGVTNRFPVDDVQGQQVAWSRDGRYLAFMATAEDSLFTIAADGSGPPEHLVFDPGDTGGVVDWHGNGDVVFTDEGDYWIGTASGETLPLLETPWFLTYGTLSPDGRWLAYATTESGDYAVYVRSYRDAGASIRVSPGYGLAPAWSRDGRRLYYRGSEDGRTVMYAVDVAPGESLRLGSPEMVFAEWPYNTTIPHRAYDPAPDGSIFALHGERSTRETYAVDDIHLFMGFSREVLQRFAGLVGIRE